MILAKARATAAQRVLRELPPDADQATVARWCRRAASAYADAGWFTEALDPAEKAENLFRDLDAPSTTDSRADLAGALYTRARCLWGAADQQAALACCAEAAGFFRVLVDAGAAYQTAYGQTLTNWSAYLVETDWKSASTVCREAVAVNENLKLSDLGRESLAAALINFSIALHQLGNFAGALEQADRAADIFGELDTADSDRYRPGLALALDNLGQRRAGMLRLDDALKATSESVRIYTELADTTGSDRFDRRLAFALSNLGLRHWALGHSSLALLPASEAVRLYAKLVTASSVRHRPRQAMAFDRLGVILSAQGKADQALKATRESVRLYYAELASAGEDSVSGRPGSGSQQSFRAALGDRTA